MFLNEFLRENVDTIEREEDLPHYCRINLTDEVVFESDKNYEEEYGEKAVCSSLLKTPNNPFSFKIKKLPLTYLNEKLVLMYEEVIYYLLNYK